MLEVKIKSKKYQKHQVLSDINLQFTSNEIVAILGKSGCGKTTLLNLMGLIDTDYEGDIIFDGVSYKTLTTEKKRSLFIRKHINYLFQNYALIDDETVEYNLLLSLYYNKELSKQAKQEQIDQVLNIVGLADKKTTKIYELSGGEQQRIAMARTLLKPCDLVLADEPTGNLDDENANNIFNLLNQLKYEGKIVIIVTHDIQLANKCDRIIKL